MKLSLIATQKTDDGKLSIEFSANLSRANKSVVLGTLLNELYSFQSLAAKHRTERFMTNAVTDIKINVGHFCFDSAQLANDAKGKIFRAKMKLRNTATGRKAFAVLVWDVLDYMSRKIENMTFEELIASIDADIDVQKIVAKLRKEESINLN